MQSPKSIHLEDDIHLQLNEIRFNLKKIGIEKTLYEIHDVAVRYGIDKTFNVIEEKENKDQEYINFTKLSNDSNLNIQLKEIQTRLKKSEIEKILVEIHKVSKKVGK